ncbi:ATPase family associated with various cellular activities (AAA) [Filimonas lacunae]|uniref:ATPase family associated with various cellular activities (AAA) n=1 Tax=Filimonas lacunae TaxID=477680 RepID=A0A173MEG6_9BACT|nr:ATP-binding protein [Filimonas lacunae]BAV05992.1 cell division protein FtsH [Filimonas lacunae]SIT24091.1 ATPase family associated with various cellular activities (AAA) [Filimonas lacunae]
MPSSLIANSATADNELRWFSEVAVARGAISFGQDAQEQPIETILPPDITNDTSLYADTIRKFHMSFEERFILALALIPHLRPEMLDMLFLKNPATDRLYTELGGQKGTVHNGYLPTGETAVFLLAGYQLRQRIELMALFDENHYFYRHNLLKLQSAAPGEPRLSGALAISAEYLTLLTTGESYRPDFGAGFPAKRLTTSLEWSDLVVSEDILDELDEVRVWLQHGQALLNDWGFKGKVKPGFRVLFSGPPGTGKTLAATLLGKSVHRDLYRIDLSMVVSKYIGETEKNLANVFDKAENSEWILFFDEADALFGKRTSTSDAHDRHANQEVSYLLQRIEDFPGLVILATNFKSNLDEAFARRFQLSINFQKPDFEQRLRLWHNAFTPPCELAPEVNLEKIAYEHELTGAAIMNVLRYCSLRALEKGTTVIASHDILRGIRKEMQKEGKNVF